MHSLVVVSAGWETEQIDQICLPGCNFYVCIKTPPPAKIPKKCAQQNTAASPFPGQFAQTQPHIGWLWCCWGEQSGRSIALGHPVTIWSCLTPPLKHQFSLYSLLPQMELPLRPTANLAPSKQPSGWFWFACFFDRADHSSLACPLQFGQGLPISPQAKFCPKIHAVTRGPRSIAWPNPTTPGHSDINHGVGVERSRWFL